MNMLFVDDIPDEIDELRCLSLSYYTRIAMKVKNF